jgi:hypothetical protein
MPEYKYPDVVRLGINAANARVPKLQKSVAAEFGAMLSKEVADGEWNMFDGQAIHSKGQNHEEYLEFLITNPERPRPHWEEPPLPPSATDAADETWTSGNLSMQGKRYNELKKFLGSDAATLAAINAEAALYGTKMGSTKPGTKPGTKPAAGNGDGAPNPYTNPWSPKFKGTPEEAVTAQLRIIKSGAKLAENLARSAGVSVFGRPLK